MATNLGHNPDDSNGCMDVPKDHGLLIILENDGTCSLQYEPDANWKEMHPHIYAPASLNQVRHLHGGGSGVTVFHGMHPTLGSLVMKHGGHKDTKEVFALAIVGRELMEREKLTPDNSAEKMRARLPEFRMIYISPSHLRNRGVEHWTMLRHAILSRRYSNDSQEDQGPLGATATEQYRQSRGIRLCRSGSDSEIVFEEEFLELGFDAIHEERFICGPIRDGYGVMFAIVRQLHELQEKHDWKFTLAQKTIGGLDAENGAALHTKGLLTDGLLNRLIDEFTDVVRCLQALTHDDEKDVVENVREELAHIRATDKETPEGFNPANLSSTADSYVGLAIKKNYDPVSGRFTKLRKFGTLFQDKKLVLSLAEETPARYLGILLHRGAPLDAAFVDLPGDRRSGLDTIDLSWRHLLEEAVGCDSKAALERIWTCGLTDAGIHNSFLSSEFLWLFDLGEPSLMPIPAFMTKFLMSFFHTLGMEDNGEGNWVQRFVVVGDKLALTTETAEILPKVYECFHTVLDSLVKNIFDSDLKVRRLLLRYVVIQLLSDAAFCLDRWRSKGGGHEKRGEEFDRKLEKWLWRALWDYYISTDVQGRLADMLKD